ncbi:MAG: hypothetical protein K6G68_11770 [Oscillospiraceae bacterium]|nr:hypothetical protein [Oscillospiraceae bacterium]
MDSRTGSKISMGRTGSASPFEIISELRQVIEEQNERIAVLEEIYAELEKDHGELERRSGNEREFKGPQFLC